jgi:hypothetical protein
MMRPDQIARVNAGLEKVGDIVPGDPVTWFDGSAEDTEGVDLVCMMEDLAAQDTAAKEEGVRTNQAGWKVGSVKRLTFWKSHLAANGVTITPAGHFMIDDERYDLKDKESVRDKIVPLAGIQSMVEYVVRKSVELNNSTSGEFSYTPPPPPEPEP